MQAADEMTARLDRAAELVRAVGRVVAFTGAGVSTESGIPDFRGSAGLWTKYDPDDFSFPNFMQSHDARRRYWAVGRELYAAMRAARPNAAHHALVTLDRAGLPASRVIELHGNATRVRCLDCARRYPRDDIQARLDAGEPVPACEACGGVLKPLTVLFGEPMPAEAVARAEALARAAGCFVVAGSSLAVYPAAYMPLYAREAGARLIVVNLTPTRLDSAADVVLTGQAGPLLAALADRVALAGARTAAPEVARRQGASRQEGGRP
jgi:NAD-dependent deacetylase